MEAAAIAVATINTLAAIRMADMQYDIAKSYLEISKWWRNYYNAAYRPVEDQELSEALNLKKEPPLYDITIGRSQSYAKIKLKGAIDNALRCTSEYCTGLREAQVKDIAIATAKAIGSLGNLGYRNERALVQARDEVYRKRRSQTAQRGRDMISNNVSFSNFASGVFGDLGKQAGLGAAGALKYFAYSQARNETLYPYTYTGSVPQQPRTMPMGPQTFSTAMWDEQTQSIVPATGEGWQ